MVSELKMKRILLKISGEALMGNRPFGHDPEMMTKICEEVRAVKESGVEVCLVVGGGNILRGSSSASLGIERVCADHMAMLGTVMNALALQNKLESINVSTRVQSAIPMTTVCEPYIRRRAMRHMEKGRVVIFAAGIGSPFFTTDTTATLRAIEMNCDAVLKGTQVEGIYSEDPKINPNAEKYDTITYREMIKKDLKVMDIAAITLARDNNMPIVVFNIRKPGELLKVISGQGSFTIVR
jgi:uridylate kinase